MSRRSLALPGPSPWGCFSGCFSYLLAPCPASCGTYEGAKREHLVVPQPGESKEAARKKVHDDLEEHDCLNREMVASYSSFCRGDGNVYAWEDIPPLAGHKDGKLVLMFLVVGKLKNEAFWRQWLAKADADGHRDHYSVVYHRGSDFGKQEPCITDDVLAKTGQAVWPPTKTGWARNGLVRATLLLLRFALEDDSNKWFVLLSDSCMPLWSFSDLYQKVTRQERSRFHNMGQSLDRCLMRNMWSSEVPLSNKHSGWKADEWAMWRREDADFFTRKHHMLKMKPKSVFVDEPYFINLMDHFERPYQNRGTTYNRWYYLADLPCFTCKNTCNAFLSSPHTFDKVDMKLINNARSRGYWFFRKVAQGAPYPSVEELEVEAVDKKSEVDTLNEKLLRQDSADDYHRDFFHTACRMQ